jgi:predicted regulator of Ras-like GTPase activity (Roadblock/LC7/MglB family)
LEQITACDGVLAEFLGESGALAVLVFDRAGTAVTARGETRDIDVTTLGALATGAYASTEELAKLIGEREFSVLFHQGDREHLLVTPIDATHLLLVIFDERTTVGLVRMSAKATSGVLAGALASTTG